MKKNEELKQKDGWKKTRGWQLKYGRGTPDCRRRRTGHTMCKKLKNQKNEPYGKQKNVWNEIVSMPNDAVKKKQRLPNDENNYSGTAEDLALVA